MRQTHSNERRSYNHQCKEAKKSCIQFRSFLSEQHSSTGSETWSHNNFFVSRFQNFLVLICLLGIWIVELLVSFHDKKQRVLLFTCNPMVLAIPVVLRPIWNGLCVLFLLDTFLLFPSLDNCDKVRELSFFSANCLLSDNRLNSQINNSFFLDWSRFWREGFTTDLKGSEWLLWSSCVVLVKIQRS